MNRVFKMLVLALAGAGMIACSSPKKMAEEAANVVVTCDPQVLEVKGLSTMYREWSRATSNSGAL